MSSENMEELIKFFIPDYNPQRGAPRTSEAVYDFLFGICKQVETSAPHHSFSAHGKHQNLTFKFLSGSLLIGSLKFRPIPCDYKPWEFKELDAEAIKELNVKLASHKQEFSAESVQVLSTMLERLTGHVKLRSADTHIKAYRKRSGNATAAISGVLSDSAGKCAGYIDLEFSLLRPRDHSPNFWMF